MEIIFLGQAEGILEEVREQSHNEQNNRFT